jgi:mono/diheme cytochrome c family protein
MIAAVVFVLAFLLLGLTVVFLAFSGGPRRQRRGRGGLSRGSRRSVLALVTVIVLGLGVAVPLAVGVVNGTDHAKSAPGVGQNLNANEVAGRATFAKYCATCHTLKASNAVGKVGPNLDNLHPPKGLVLDAIAKGRARGQGQMPSGLIQGQDAQNVAAYIAKVAGQSQ